MTTPARAPPPRIAMPAVASTVKRPSSANGSRRPASLSLIVSRPNFIARLVSERASASGGGVR